MNETTPKISVIVPVYKAENYLHRCVDSLLVQTFQDFEILLIDDGSPDRSGKICDEYARKDKRIRVFHKENGGVSSARNLGLDHARGEWIIFSDADDYFLLNNAFALLLKCTEDARVDLVLADALVLQDGRYRILLGLRDCVQRNDIHDIKHFALWGYLFSAKIIQDNQIRFVDGLAYSEDRIFIYHFARYTQKIAYNKEPVYVYRINGSSACQSRDGLKKACSQIDAAHQVRVLAQKLFREDTLDYRYLLERSVDIANNGISQFARLGFSLKNLPVVKDKYTDCFGDDLNVRFRFYVRLFNICIKYQVHRLIRKYKCLL